MVEAIYGVPAPCIGMIAMYAIWKLEVRSGLLPKAHGKESIDCFGTPLGSDASCNDDIRQMIRSGLI